MKGQMIADIEVMLADAVKEVFSTMLNIDAQKEPPGTALANGEPHIASSVGFIGRATGVVYLYSTGSFARKMTRSLLRLEDSEVAGDEMVNDAMGELANMVVGHIKSRLCDRGINCALTIPSIVRGSHFSIETVSSTERRVLMYRCNGNQVAVEVLVKPTRSN